MAQVISATHKFGLAAGTGKSQRFLSQGYDLLDKARSEIAAGRFEQALEFAYQAALRTAGAWVASSAIARRKRLPSSAWDRLKLVGGQGQAWSEKLRSYSRLRARVISGLEDDLAESKVLELLALVGQFISATEGFVIGDGGFSAAA